MIPQVAGQKMPPGWRLLEDYDLVFMDSFEILDLSFSLSVKHAEIVIFDPNRNALPVVREKSPVPAAYITLPSFAESPQPMQILKLP